MSNGLSRETQEALEKYIVLAKWGEGIINERSPWGGLRQHRTLSLPLDRATADEREAALELLIKKYHFGTSTTTGACLVESSSVKPGKKIHVLRIIGDDDIRRLLLIKRLWEPTAWKTTFFGERSQGAALNFGVQKFPSEDIDFVREVLNGQGIAHLDMLSRSLASQGSDPVRVIRVVGDNIIKLHQSFPSLKGLADDARRPGSRQSIQGTKLTL